MHLRSVALALLVLTGSPGRACTIFVLTDAKRALFFNNEDWSNPATRLWFVPAGTDYLGCAYLGFDDGWAQGGLNSAGLAFDWVAGGMEKWEREPAMKSVRGNPAQRMLETCTTVDEAITFFRACWEPGFARGRIMVADRSGASAIIGAAAGRLKVERANDSRGFGYGWDTLARRLAPRPEPTVSNGVAILNACLQSGATPTRYSNAFDLKTGGIVLFPSPGRDESVSLDLMAELAKGGHAYDLATIRDQIGQRPIPLQQNQVRFYLDKFKPLAEQEPAIAQRVTRLIRDAADGTMRAQDYVPEFWVRIHPAQKQVQAEMQQLGELGAAFLVGRNDDAVRRSYLYLLDFKQARVLQRYTFDLKDAVISIATEGAELKHDRGAPVK
ncbi:MAG: hypothetical protein ABIZ81_00950 [Opitutaceae bacterium]